MFSIPTMGGVRSNSLEWFERRSETDGIGFPRTVAPLRPENAQQFPPLKLSDDDDS